MLLGSRIFFCLRKRVKAGLRFTNILNQRMVKKQELAILNCSKDVNYFLQIVNDFYAIAQKFYDACHWYESVPSMTWKVP